MGIGNIITSAIVSLAVAITGFFGLSKSQPAQEPNFGEGPRVLLVSQGGTATSTFVTGDVLYAEGTNNLGSLPIGSAGQVLKVSGGVPSWGTDAGGSGASSWEAITTNLLTPTNTLAGIIVRGSSTIDNNLRVTGSVNASTTVTDNLKVLSTCIGCNNTSTPDYIISKVGNTVFSTETRTGNVISSNNSADVVLGATLGHATTTRLMNGADIFVKDGEYFLNATTTFYGKGNNASNTWKLHGAGQDKTKFVVNNDSTAFNLTNWAKIDFRNFSIYVTDGETAISSNMATNDRSVWNSVFDSIHVLATTTNYSGTAFLLENELKNSWNNIRLDGVTRCFRWTSDSSVTFNPGDSVYSNISCSGYGNTTTGAVSYDINGGSNLINQNTFINVGGFSNVGSNTFFRLTRSKRNVFLLESEGYATTTELYNNSDYNSFKYEYLIGSTTPSVYFKTDSTSDNNTFSNTYIDSYSGTHYLFKDSNSSAGSSNIVQGWDGASFITTGSGVFKNATTSISIVRDWDKNGNGTWNQVKNVGNKLVLDAFSGSNQFLTGSATSTLSNGIVIDTNTLVVNSNENAVGIGTASPTSTLTIVGAEKIQGTLTTTGLITSSGNSNTYTSGDGSNVNTWMNFAGTRGFVGFNATNGTITIQGGSSGGTGKGIEFNVNNTTFGSGTVGRVSPDGRWAFQGVAADKFGFTVATTTSLLAATSTNLGVTGLNAANCDVMADTNGSFYCGTNGSGSTGGNGAWETFATNVIRPTNTSAAILVNAASSTITQLVSNNATISTLNSTSTNIGTLVVYTGSTFPANDITDAEVSDTLTASDLQAASAVVADSEVVDALTINTSIEAIYTGNIRSNHINATSTNVGTLTGYGLATLPDLRASMLNSTTTNIGTLNVFTQSSLAKATATNFAVTTLTAANCDVKASTIGDFYCGTDATGAGGGEAGAWEAFSANVLRPTNTTAAILINSASSTITRFNSNGATISDINATTTQVGTLMVYGGATSTNLAVLGMTAANCDVKATTAGTFYCGIDAGGAGSDMNSWESFGTNVLRPTNTAASILVNVATSTITNLTMNNATSTGNFVVGTSVWQAPTSSLSILGGLHVFNSVATSSEAVWIGSGGVANGINLQGGDLYVQGDVEIDGVLGTTGSRVSEAYFDTVDTNNITIGGDTISEFAGSGLTVSGNALTVTGKAPAGFNGAWETLAANILRPTNTTAAIIVNSATSTITNLKMNNSTTTDFGIFGTSALAAPTNTVSIIGNSFIQGRSTSTATSTVGGFRVTDDEGAVQHGVEIIPGATTTLRFY